MLLNAQSELRPRPQNIRNSSYSGLLWIFSLISKLVCTTLRADELLGWSHGCVSTSTGGDAPAHTNWPTCFILPFCSPHTRALKRIGPHNYDVLSVIYGSMLGDSNAEKHGNGTRIRLQQVSSNVEYLMWFHKFLADRGHSSNTKPKLLTRIGEGGKKRFYYQIRTWTFTSFNRIYDHFYPDGVSVGSLPLAATKGCGQGDGCAS